MTAHNALENRPVKRDKKLPLPIKLAVGAVAGGFIVEYTIEALPLIVFVISYWNNLHFPH